MAQRQLFPQKWLTSLPLSTSAQSISDHLLHLCQSASSSVAQDYSTGDACSFQVWRTNSKLATVWFIEITCIAVFSTIYLQSSSVFPRISIQYFAESSSLYMSVILSLFNREWRSAEPNGNQKNFLQAISTEDQKQGMETHSCSHITAR